MLNVKEEYTDEPCYSLGRSAMTQEQIWETEDNGGFKKVVVDGEVDNMTQYDAKSVKKAVSNYQKLIKSGESVAVFCLDNASIPVSSAYAKINKLEVTPDNKVKAQMTLVDTPNGNMAYTILKNFGQERLTLKGEGMGVGDKFDTFLNIKLTTV